MERDEQMYTLHTQLDFARPVGTPDPAQPRPCSEARVTIPRL